MKRFPHLLIIIILSVFLLCGCNNLMFREYDKIEYNGNIYDVTSDWKPKGEKLNEKITVNLVDNYSSIDYNNYYYAYGFAGDDEQVFLFFNKQIYVKTGYKFPDLIDKKIEIERIDLLKIDSPIHKLYSFNNKDFIKLFMSEY